MSEGGLLTPVADDEFLARYILYNRHVRSSDSTVKPDAFIPYPYPDLSVTRHIGLTEGEIWELGQAVAEQRPATLYGRADVVMRAVKRQGLAAVPTETPRNHANITGWPADKPTQKMIAQELAAGARYVRNPAHL